MSRPLRSLIPVGLLAIVGGCSYPFIDVFVVPRAPVVVAGESATVITTTISRECVPDDNLPCVDPTGLPYDYVLQNVPDGVSYDIDRSLQTPSTPDVVRITFHTAPSLPPNQYTVAVHATLDGRSIGMGEVTLRVLPASSPAPASGIVAIAAGDDHSLAARADGSVLAWGSNSAGQLGVGRTGGRTEPVAVGGLDGIVGVAAGARHSFALTANGRVWGWGANGYRQVANDPRESLHSPVEIDGLHNIVALSAGSRHSLALREDGTVWTWGSSSLHEGSDSPAVQIAGLPRVRAIAADAGYSLAVGADGTLWMWGDVEQPLGRSDVLTTPVQVAGLSGLHAIAARDGSIAAVDVQGRVWTWGRNDGGQLGDGTTEPRFVPAVVPGLPQIATIAVGEQLVVALGRDGTVWHWGEGPYGPMLEGLELTPVLVPELTGARAIAVGRWHALALTACGQLWSWAGNDAGQLGDGTREDRTPFPIPGVADESGCDRVALRLTVAGGGSFAARDVLTTEGIDRVLPSDFDLIAVVGRGSQVTVSAESHITVRPQTIILDLPGETRPFERWAIDCGGSELTTTMVMDRSRVCAAVYPSRGAQGALLTVLSDGGRVTSTGDPGVLGPEHIDCPTTCGVIYEQDAEVTLSAASAPGFTFSGWERSCEGGAAETTVTMDASKTCLARFRPYELNVSVTGGGTITSDPAGIGCGVTCSYAPRRATAVLTATAARGWQFESWGGDCAGTSPQASVSMTADRSCTATFVRIPGFFFLNVVLEGDGSVTSAPDGISCPGTCGALLPAGPVVLTAHETPSSFVLGWFDDCAAAASPTRPIVLDRDTQCRVRFSSLPPVPIAEFTAPSSARVGQIVAFDGNASHVFDPVMGTRDLAGIRSFSWDFDGDPELEASGPRSTAAVAQHVFQTPGDHAVTLFARGGPFEETDTATRTVSVQPATNPLFGLTVTLAGDGEGVVATDPPGVIGCRPPCASSGPVMIEAGATVALRADALAGSVFVGWSGPGCSSTASQFAITMNGARDCVATFQATQPTLTIVMNAAGVPFARVSADQPPGSAIDCRASNGPVCSESHPAGTVIVLRPDSLSAETGAFDGWSGCDSLGPGFTCTVVLTTSRTVTANFAPQ